MKNLREVKVGPIAGGALKKLPHAPKGPLNPKSKAAKTDDEKPDPDAALVAYVNDCHTKGDEYRRKFKTRWDEIEAQIRCVHPESWAEKEDWQTKVFVPQQSKTSETAQAYLDKMLFGTKRFFGIQGTEQRDKDEEAAIEELYDNFLYRGNFAIENDFVLNEACSGPGTSFIKITVKPDRTGLNFTWRSAYNVTIDPAACHKLEYAQYIIDEYDRPLQTLIDDVTKGTSIYSKAKIDALVKAAETDGQSLSDKALATVKGFDGTAVSIDPSYKMVKIKEFWGMAKTSEKKDGKETETWDDRIVAVANGKMCIRNDHNDYGFKSFFACRVKPRKYDFYALGFLENVVDLQELTNSMINLGFDSLKMCSMDIAAIDESKVKDAASIEYRPMAVWKFKGPPSEAMLLTRQGISALGEIMRALALLDQFSQEATGVLRQVQGAPALGGGSGETLGEYQAKLAMIDNRFLKIARFIERDYIEPMLRGIFKIIFNDKFFNQKLVDRVIGTKTLKTPDPMNPQGPPIEKEVSKLDYAKIVAQGEMGYDFAAYGMTQFSKSLETLQKLRELLEIVVKTPQLQILFNIKELVKRTLRAAEIQDFEDLMKSEDEIKNIMQQVYSGTGGGQPQPGQPPQGPPMPEPAAY